MNGIRRMGRQELEEAYGRAMAAGAYAMAERVAFELNEPRTTYVPPVRPRDLAA